MVTLLSGADAITIPSFENPNKTKVRVRNSTCANYKQ